jgi:hypothetical protein
MHSLEFSSSANRTIKFSKIFLPIIGIVARGDRKAFVFYRFSFSIKFGFKIRGKRKTISHL